MRRRPVACDLRDWIALWNSFGFFCWIVASVVLDEIKFNVDADVTVIVPDKKHQPGDNVVVCVAVSSREDFYFRRGILRLVSWEIVHTKDGPLERVLWSSERRFGNSTRLVSRQEHREEIAVALPKRWETNFIGAFWGVRVTLNIPGAKDFIRGVGYRYLAIRLRCLFSRILNLDPIGVRDYIDLP
ncbi:MAG: hypothetical protein Ct9H300mP11_29800 [Chloroflexota bacterium]|nr:MAG: hypothetical protein Ct9H300mP11_29800 [Chloroflexota bacterium]